MPKLRRKYYIILVLFNTTIAVITIFSTYLSFNRHIFTEWIRQMELCYDKQLSDDDTSRKSDEIALLWRQRGNVKFKAEQYDESHKLYTKSVLFADKDNPLYSVALANRSAASLRLKRYKVPIIPNFFHYNINQISYFLNTCCFHRRVCVTCSAL